MTREGRGKEGEEAMPLLPRELPYIHATFCVHTLIIAYVEDMIWNHSVTLSYIILN